MDNILQLVYTIQRNEQVYNGVVECIVCEMCDVIRLFGIFSSPSIDNSVCVSFICSMDVDIGICYPIDRLCEREVSIK